MHSHLLEVLVHDRQQRLLHEADRRRLRRQLRAVRRSNQHRLARYGPHHAPADCDFLGLLIEREGIGAAEDELQLFLARARAADVSPTLLAIAGGPEEPANARARAFGRICAEMAGNAPAWAESSVRRAA